MKIRKNITRLLLCSLFIVACSPKTTQENKDYIEGEDYKLVVRELKNRYVAKLRVDKTTINFKIVQNDVFGDYTRTSLIVNAPNYQMDDKYLYDETGNNFATYKGKDLGMKVPYYISIEQVIRFENMLL